MNARINFDHMRSFDRVMAVLNEEGDQDAIDLLTDFVLSEKARPTTDYDLAHGKSLLRVVSPPQQKVMRIVDQLVQAQRQLENDKYTVHELGARNLIETLTGQLTVQYAQLPDYLRIETSKKELN